MANTRNLYNKGTTELKTPELENAQIPADGFKYNFDEINDIIDEKISLNNEENNAAYRIERGYYENDTKDTNPGNATISGMVPKLFNGDGVTGWDNHTIYAKVVLDDVHNSGSSNNVGNQSTTTLTQGGTFKIPKLTIDAKGRVTDSADITFTLPSGLVNTVNNFTGGITIASGTNISVSPNNGTITIGTTATPSFTTVTVTSSEEFKKNIKPFEKNAIDLLDNINVVEYNYKCEEDNDIPHVGFIAEQTEELFSSKEKNKHRFVDTIGVLIKAVQELNEKIERIEKEIDKCQKK